MTPACGPPLLRRYAALFAIGAVHAALLWFGDIRTLYAALGLLLVALRNITAQLSFALAFAAVVNSRTTAGQWRRPGSVRRSPGGVHHRSGQR